MAQIRFETPTGTVAVRETDDAITEVGWVRDWKRDRKRDWTRDGASDEETPLLAEARRQILEYFDGRPRTFDLPLSPHGPAFQQAVRRRSEETSVWKECGRTCRSRWSRHH